MRGETFFWVLRHTARLLSVVAGMWQNPELAATTVVMAPAKILNEDVVCK